MVSATASACDWHWDCVRATRFGHGIAAVDDCRWDDTGCLLDTGPVASQLLDNKVPLEVCITSNLQTKRWAADAHPHQTSQLQTLVSEFVDEYNHRRPHRSIGRTTPHIAYTRLPKDQPHHDSAGNRYRIRHDIIDNTGAVSLRRAGRMHNISIGRAHKHTPVILIIDDLDIRVINKPTGELLRAFTLNPDIGYQPRVKT